MFVSLEFSLSKSEKMSTDKFVSKKNRFQKKKQKEESKREKILKEEQQLEEKHVKKERQRGLWKCNGIDREGGGEFIRIGQFTLYNLLADFVFI